MSDNTNAVLGEETLNTADVQVKEIPLIPVGKYPCNLKGLSVHCGKEWNSVPNVSIQNKLEKRVVFSTLLMSLQPDVNGQLHISRKNGAKAFLKAFDVNIEGWKIHKEMRTDPKTGEQVEIKFLDAAQLVEAMSQYKDAAYQIRVTIQKANPPYPEKNDVFEYFPAE